MKRKAEKGGAVFWFCREIESGGGRYWCVDGKITKLGDRLGKSVSMVSVRIAEQIYRVLAKPEGGCVPSNDQVKGVNGDFDRLPKLRGICS